MSATAICPACFETYDAKTESQAKALERGFEKQAIAFARRRMGKQPEFTDAEKKFIKFALHVADNEFNLSAADKRAIKRIERKLG